MCNNAIPKILICCYQEAQSLLTHHARNGRIITDLCLWVSKYQRRLQFVRSHILVYSYGANTPLPHGIAKSAFKGPAFDKMGSCCNIRMWTGCFLCCWSRTISRTCQKKAQTHGQSMNRTYETSGTPRLKTYEVFCSQINLILTENLNYFGILTIFVAWFSSHLVLLFWSWSQFLPEKRDTLSFAINEKEVFCFLWTIW